MAIRLLIIDDNPDQIQITRRILEKAGRPYQLDEAADAKQGLAKLSSQDGGYDLVLCDYRLPGVSGMDFLRQVKQGGPNVPVVLVTAMGDERIAVEAIQSGAYDYVVKDASYDELLVGVIEQSLERHREHKELDRLEAERKQAEEQLRQAHEQLKQSHEALQAAQLQLIQSEKLESVGRLAAGVAHEVKNPLAIILMGAEYLTKRLTDGDDTTRNVLKEMAEAVKRADRIIKGVLDFSASRVLDVSLQSLRPIVEQALLLVKRELTRAHLIVAVRVADALPPLALDRQKMEQVFVNLFMNAIHAMPAGGTLTVTAAVKRLTEVGHGAGRRTTDRFRIGEEAVVVTVEDTGTGVPADTLLKIFDPFFTTKPVGQGTGLGLTVVQKIIALHDGTIDVTNRPEGGVRVTMLLPVTRRA